MPTKKKPAIVEGSDAVAASSSLAALSEAYLEAQLMLNKSPRTIESWRRVFNTFIQWCQMRNIERPEDVSKKVLERYRRHLFYWRTKDDKPLTIRTQYMRLSALRGWFKWLTQEDYLSANPASELDLPKVARALPKAVLTPQEAQIVLQLPGIHEPIGIRDRAILETIYATGLRRMEVARLGMYDLDFNREIVHVRQGKGGSDRIVPISPRALQWLQRYLEEVRPLLISSGQLFKRKSNPTRNTANTRSTTQTPIDRMLPHGMKPAEVLLLTQYGEPFNATALGHLVARYIRQANIPGKTSGGCHLLRHSLATSMLENGADIRYVQEMLGHKKLETTQIYTRVSIQKLQEIYQATTPSKAREKPTGTSD